MPPYWFNEAISIKNIALLPLIVATLHGIMLQTDGLAIDQQPFSSQSIELKTTDTVKTASNVTTSTTRIEITTMTTIPRLESKSNNITVASSSRADIRPDHRRPIWVIAHMVNSIKELELRLGTGANAIEADVTFGRDGVPQFTYHGPPCDCWRHCHQQENFNDYLNFVREIAIEEADGIGRNLSLLFLDLKLDYLDQHAKINAGIELAKSILENLFPNSNSNQPLASINSQISINQLEQKQHEQQADYKQSLMLPFYLILSVNHVTDIDLIHNFIHQLENNNSSQLMDSIGFDVGMNDDLKQIDSMWRRFNAGASLNLWQGDGFTNCFSPFYNLERLSKALLKRDQKMGYPAKVYHWTIDLHDRMRESLRMGVDAIMTNHPERVLAILNEPDIAHEFRLADRQDDPFRKIPRARLVGRSSGETARYQRSASITSGGFLGNLIDVISSWLNYMREIPYLSLPTTTRLFARTSSVSTNSRHKHSKPSQSFQAKVNLENQPVYKLDTLNGSEHSPRVTASSSKDEPKSLPKISIRNSIEDKNAIEDEEPMPYDGPKWYTSLASNVLVSIMKILLPVQ